MRYRLTLSYRGTAYAGWQRQANALAVQQVVETALSDLLAEPLTVHGASRTDTGVHARGQVVHLDLPRAFACSGLVHGTNHRLPDDVRVLEAEGVSDEFHARYSALGKEYVYRLVQTEVLSPLDAPYALRTEALDVDALRRAAERLIGRHDWSAFALAGGAHTSPVRTVTRAEWIELGPELRFHIAGQGFLRGMVRGLVGTLLEVGQGRRTVGELAALLAGGSRAAAGNTAPAQGLCLERVFY